MRLKNYKLFGISLGVAIALATLKMLLHELDWEVLRQSSLHTSVVTGTFFVVGFLLSTTIADYKESERIPSEFSSILENMYEDAKSSHPAYPDFNLEKFRLQLISVAKTFKKDVRNKTHNARHEVHKLSESFAEMEQAKVPPNFVVKLKQQQAQLARSLFRVNYIQTISFIPSASILARSIVIVSTVILLVTNIEPFYGGIAIMAIINFILVYMLLLIEVISIPFHPAGQTQDDISLYLVGDAISYLQKQK